MNRYVSYSFGVLADKSSMEMFAPHISKVMKSIKKMHTASLDDEAKDNCIATLAKIADNLQ